MAAGAGGDPTAERREAEALREVAEREPLGPELGLELWAVDPGLDAGRPRDGVELEEPVEPVHGHGHDGVGLRRVHAPHDGRPGAEGHHLRAVRRAPVEDGDELVLRARVGHDVGRVGEVEVERVGAVGEVGAVGVERPLPRLGGAAPGERVRHPDAGRAQLGVGQVGYRRRRDGDTEALRQVLGAAGPILVGRLLRLESPGPEGTTRRHGATLRRALTGPASVTSSTSPGAGRLGSAPGAPPSTPAPCRRRRPCRPGC